MNPFAGLLRSRKFLLLAIDTIVSGAALIGGWYLAPEELGKVVAFIALVQPMFVFVVYGITAEDVAKLNAGVHPNQQP